MKTLQKVQGLGRLTRGGRQVAKPARHPGPAASTELRWTHRQGRGAHSEPKAGSSLAFQKLLCAPCCLHESF